jgi:hypothetical protein
MLNLIAGALAASILAAPAAAVAQSQDPIAIQSVHSVGTEYNSYAPGVVNVAFRNDGASVVREVTFLVTDSAGNQATVQDVGTFSPGVTIHDNLRVAKLGDSATVRVVEVQYADGSTWYENPQSEQS